LKFKENNLCLRWKLNLPAEKAIIREWPRIMRNSHRLHQAMSKEHASQNEPDGDEPMDESMESEPMTDSVKNHSGVKMSFGAR
jgi:hypothetical protein